MEQWCRLTLDVLLYLGVTAIRRVRLEHSEEITGVSRARTVQAHNKWFDLIMTLYRSIQEERAELKKAGEKLFKNYNAENEEKLLRQQKIIKAGWK